VGLSAAFLHSGLRYVLSMAPRVSEQVESWRRLAEQIPSPELRAHALQALSKRGNIEGAALFAVLAPPSHRLHATRALVAFQSAYNYLDTLSELPNRNPVENGEQLHAALLAALRPDDPQPDYYAWSHDGHDGGYLDSLVSACRESLVELPSFSNIAAVTRQAATRIVKFQALNLSEAHGGHFGLERWAAKLGTANDGLYWWETAAAAGSSLPVYALMAAAGGAGIGPRAAEAIDAAYFPWVGALHSLLDSLVDRGEDEERGQPSLLDYYTSSSEAAERFGLLADRACDSLGALRRPRVHQSILAAMGGYYLSAPQRTDAHYRAVETSLGSSLNPSLDVALLAFRGKRFAHSFTDPAYI
jgi:tetraprenyl-beta-curcumene synthase